MVLIMLTGFWYFLQMTVVTVASCTFSSNDGDDSMCGCPIPGTLLYPRQLYAVSMVVYPNGNLLYSNWTHREGHRYMIVTHEANHTSERQSQGQSAHIWKFIETELPGWYHFVPNDYPDAFATRSVSKNDILYGESISLVLDENYPGKHKTRMDFFIRPVRPPGVTSNQYQLKFKTASQYTIKPSDFRGTKQYSTVEIDMSNVIVMTDYSPRGKYFKQTLFQFNPV